MMEDSQPANQTEPRWIILIEWLALIAIVALAAHLRYWRIEEVPPGFNSDEAVGAMGALTTLREGFRYSYEGQGGGGALGFYFAAASFYLFGPSIAAIRGVAAWAGVMSIFFNYWAIRELFRSTGLNRARWLAGLATLGLAVSLWHISASRIAFAGIGVPFLMLPSVYFLWRGLNSPNQPLQNRKSLVAFIASGIFLGALMYIYLSVIFAPPFYALFFIAQWLIVKLVKRFNGKPDPPTAYLTSHFWGLAAAALTAALLLLPMLYVLLFRPELEPGTTRASQAIFTNPQINQGDPWGLLWRSFTGNFSAYGISPSWFIGQPPRLSLMPVPVGLVIFLGFLITLWHSLRGKATYLFILLWFCVMLLPSILSPDLIPHNLRTIGATTPTFVFAAIFIIWLFEGLCVLGRRWLQPALGSTNFIWPARGLGLALAVALIWILGRATSITLYSYFYIFPETNDAKAAYHVYAVEMAEVINQEPSAEVAFVLPRNTAAGDVFRNFTTDFLTELAQPPADHYWVIDDERTLAADLTAAAAQHSTIRLVQWKTSKHTGADPKEAIPYYLEKYGHYAGSDSYEYFDVHTYQLDAPAPDFNLTETLLPANAAFGQQLRLTGYALGDAGQPQAVNTPQAGSNDLLWLRLAWHKTAEHAENLKVSALIYTEDGQLVTQVDKLLISNILQVGSAAWPVGAQEETYFLIHIPPATPAGSYHLQLAVYGADSLARLPVNASTGETNQAGSGSGLLPLAEFKINPAQIPVHPDKLELALPVKQPLLPGLNLVGFETLPGETVRSGQEVGASLIWQAGESPPSGDLSMALIAKPKEGKESWPLTEPVGLAGTGYPSSTWQPGELLRGWLKARIPPAFEPGIYELSLRLALAADPQQEVLLLPIGDFEVEGWPRNFDPPQPQLEIGATYGDKAVLVGLDADLKPLAPGAVLPARLYWQAAAEFDQNYTVFVQLIGPDGRLYGQVDQTPGAGAFPTTGWLTGEYIVDEYTVPLAADAPPGDYQVAIGLYNPDTGQRLPVQGGNCQPDVCLLSSLKVQ
jgi:4-amino-4-deoxy-L-arabinose transferase-like glycosyltransferase